MNRYLMPIILAILVLVSGVLIGCNGDYQQRLAKLEQQMQELSNENRLQPKVIEPKVIEKDIEIYSGNPARLQFYLEVGDSVEGEVSVSHSHSIMFGEVKDPYGNTILESRRRLIHLDPLVYENLQKYPWSFAFIAPTDGEYELKIRYTPINRSSTMILEGQPLVHLKIVRYTGN